MVDGENLIRVRVQVTYDRAMLGLFGFSGHRHRLRRGDRPGADRDYLGRKAAMPHRVAPPHGGSGGSLTGFGALVVLVGLLVGGPIALLAFAGNPLPDHVPTLAEIGTALTSRDDGQLFLRALALVGWFGWATFALSVLVELGAQACVGRRPGCPAWVGSSGPPQRWWDRSR